MSERSKRIEEAARALVDGSMWSPVRGVLLVQGDIDGLRAALAMVEDAPDEYRRGVLDAAGEVDRQRAVAEAQGHGEALAYLDDLITQLRLMGKGEP